MSEWRETEAAHDGFNALRNQREKAATVSVHVRMPRFTESGTHYFSSIPSKAFTLGRLGSGKPWRFSERLDAVIFC